MTFLARKSPSPIPLPGAFVVKKGRKLGLGLPRSFLALINYKYFDCRFQDGLNVYRATLFARVQSIVDQVSYRLATASCGTHKAACSTTSPIRDLHPMWVSYSFKRRVNEFAHRGVVPSLGH